MTQRVNRSRAASRCRESRAQSRAPLPPVRQPVTVSVLTRQIVARDRSPARSWAAGPCPLCGAPWEASGRAAIGGPRLGRGLVGEAPARPVYPSPCRVAQAPRTGPHGIRPQVWRSRNVCPCPTRSRQAAPPRTTVSPVGRWDLAPSARPRASWRPAVGPVATLVPPRPPRA